MSRSAAAPCRTVSDLLADRGSALAPTPDPLQPKRSHQALDGAASDGDALSAELPGRSCGRRRPGSSPHRRAGSPARSRHRAEPAAATAQAQPRALSVRSRSQGRSATAHRSCAGIRLNLRSKTIAYTDAYSRGRARVLCSGAFLTPCYRRLADVAFECPVEGRLRFVPDAISHLSNREARLKYEMFR
jgi:hypothetical protein